VSELATQAWPTELLPETRYRGKDTNSSEWSTTSLCGAAQPLPSARSLMMVQLSFTYSLFFFFFFFFLVFRDMVFLYSPGCPGTHFVAQAGLELRNPPASASRVLGLKACATTPGYILFLLMYSGCVWACVNHSTRVEVRGQPLGTALLCPWVLGIGQVIKQGWRGCLCPENPLPGPY
jgi:hypothetical protein